MIITGIWHVGIQGGLPQREEIEKQMSWLVQVTLTPEKLEVAEKYVLRYAYNRLSLWRNKQTICSLPTPLRDKKATV